MNYDGIATLFSKMGLGNSSCGPGVLKKYAIDPNKKHQLRIRILD